MRRKKWAQDRQRELVKKLKQNQRDGRVPTRSRLNELKIVSLYALRERSDWLVIRLRELAFGAECQLRSALYPEACIDITRGRRTPSRGGASSSAEHAAQQSADQVGNHLRSYRCNSRDLYEDVRIDITLGPPTVPGVDDDGLVARYALYALGVCVLHELPAPAPLTPEYSLLYPLAVFWRCPPLHEDVGELYEYTASGFPPETIIRLLLHTIGGAQALTGNTPRQREGGGRHPKALRTFIAIAMNLLMLPFPFTYLKARPAYFRGHADRHLSERGQIMLELLSEAMQAVPPEMIERVKAALWPISDAHTLARCGICDYELVHCKPAPVAPLLAIARKLLVDAPQEYWTTDRVHDWVRWVTPDPLPPSCPTAPKQDPALGVVATVLHRAGCLEGDDPGNTVKSSFNRWHKAWVRDPAGEMHELRAWLAARFQPRSGLGD